MGPSASGMTVPEQRGRREAQLEDEMEHLDIHKLRQRFNDASESVRLVTLLSPT